MPNQGSLSIRTVFWGILFTLWAALSCPYVVINIQSYGLAADYITAGALLGLFVLVFLINPFLGCLKRRLMLSEGDLITVYSMMLVASAIPSWGIALNLIPILSGLHYFATPQNRWTELVLPHLKPWLLPPAAVSSGFFEGLPAGTPIPYSAWIRPLSIWLTFFFLMSLFSIALMSIFRKEWTDREHLAFPLTILPREMISRPEGALFPSLFRKRIFWFGFAISFLVIFINGIHYYLPMVPEFKLYQQFSIFRSTTPLYFFFNFPILGLAYLLSLDILFSLWFFQLLATCEVGWFNISGYSLPGHNEAQCAFSTATSFQGMGAMIVLVFFLIWRGRKHLAVVFRNAFRRSQESAQEEEILSYRQAVWLLIFSFLGMLVWLICTGMNLLVSLIFLISAFVVILGLTRIVCQAGVGFLRSPNSPPVFTSYSLPSPVIGERGFANLGLHWSWTSDIRTTVMASTANSLKLTEDRPNLRRLSFFFLLLFAMVLAYVSSSWLVLKSGYERGVLNSSNTWFFRGLPMVTGDFVRDKILNPPTLEVIRWRVLFTGLGGLFMFFLVAMHSRFLWWPIHYVGFPIVDTWVSINLWFPVFIAWLIKSLVLRYGGPGVYRKTVPLFLGLILGQIVGAGVWLVIDNFAGTIGNVLPIGVP